MTIRTRLLTGLILLVLSMTAQANCGLKYQACKKVCQVRHLTDGAAEAGCVSKCVADRGICLVKVGAEKTVEAGEGAWDKTKSFFSGMTEE